MGQAATFRDDDDAVRRLRRANGGITPQEGERPVQAVAPRNSGVGPQLQQVPMQPQAIASDPSQRPLSASPVRSTGPAQGVPNGADARTLQKGRPASVLDASGKPVNGMIQVAPNRVYDPNSGRYHWTDTSGQQQKLRD